MRVPWDGCVGVSYRGGWGAGGVGEGVPLPIHSAPLDQVGGALMREQLTLEVPHPSKPSHLQVRNLQRTP